MLTTETSDGNILKVTVSGKLEESDFRAITPQVEELIKSHGSIRLIIDAIDFDGWADMRAAKNHFTFVRDHQKHIDRVALIAGYMWQHWIAGIAGAFVHPDIKAFDKGQRAEAEAWLRKE